MAPGLFRNLKGTGEDQFKIGKNGPLLERIIASARLRLPDLLRWLPGGAAVAGHLVSDSSGDLDIIQDNLSALVAPTVTDDVNSGYAVSSVWINTVTDKFYICVDSSVGAANWLNLSSGKVRSFPCFRDNSSFIQINVPVFTTVLFFRYNGSIKEGAFDVVKAIMGTANIGNVAAVRLYDFTNSTVVAVNANVTHTVTNTPNIVSLNINSANIPTGEAILELQVRKVSGAGGVQIYELDLEY